MAVETEATSSAKTRDVGEEEQNNGPNIAGCDENAEQSVPNIKYTAADQARYEEEDREAYAAYDIAVAESWEEWEVATPEDGPEDAEITASTARKHEQEEQDLESLLPTFEKVWRSKEVKWGGGVAAAQGKAPPLKALAGAATMLAGWSLSWANPASPTPVQVMIHFPVPVQVLREGRLTVEVIHNGCRSGDVVTVRRRHLDFFQPESEGNSDGDGEDGGRSQNEEEEQEQEQDEWEAMRMGDALMVCTENEALLRQNAVMPPDQKLLTPEEEAMLIAPRRRRRGSGGGP